MSHTWQNIKTIVSREHQCSVVNNDLDLAKDHMIQLQQTHTECMRTKTPKYTRTRKVHTSKKATHNSGVVHILPVLRAQRSNNHFSRLHVAVLLQPTDGQRSALIIRISHRVHKHSIFRLDKALYTHACHT
jgi:hypothetical protein